MARQGKCVWTWRHRYARYESLVFIRDRVFGRVRDWNRARLLHLPRLARFPVAPRSTTMMVQKTRKPRRGNDTWQKPNHMPLTFGASKYRAPKSCAMRRAISWHPTFAALGNPTCNSTVPVRHLHSLPRPWHKHFPRPCPRHLCHQRRVCLYLHNLPQHCHWISRTIVPLPLLPEPSLPFPVSHKIQQ
jgi:hypothetical protein